MSNCEFTRLSVVPLSNTVFPLKIIINDLKSVYGNLVVSLKVLKTQMK